MSKKKIAAIASGILILLGGGAAVRQKAITTREASAINTSTATRSAFVKTVSSSGKTKAEKSVDLKFQTSGKLTWVGVKEGDTVTKGQAIAMLDLAEFQANLRQEEQDFVAAKAESERLYNNQGYKTVESFDEKVARTAVDAAQNKAYDNVVKARQNLANATLITPIDGAVTHIDTPVAGINVTPATAVFTVVDPNSLVFEVNADETDVGELEIGQKAQISLDAYPGATFSGTISYISFSSQLSAGGATVFPVQISFDQPQNIRIGLNGDVTIDTKSNTDALTIPLEALREENGSKFVFKKEGTKYIKTRIQTGDQNDTVVVVEGGLSEGDIVVTRGFNALPKT